jgi:hypothetical protein
LLVEAVMSRRKRKYDRIRRLSRRPLEVSVGAGPLGVAARGDADDVLTALALLALVALVGAAVRR